ncbi:MAG: TrkH family potassium uptake protein [Candidatus Omnitrophica bacterium]|nr:TrkH family potassium uptake protein [Candidatus Omnitrophota bacterium]
MNYRFVFNQLGKLLVVLGAALFFVAIAERTFDEASGRSAIRALLTTAFSGAAIGGLLWWRTQSTLANLGRREALLLVALSWIVGAAFAGSPYYFWAHMASGVEPNHRFLSAINCYFEAMSGLTTTGATILSDIESIPRSLLLWRAFTHWLGGLGIVLLFVAVLPSLGVGGKKLYQIEAPGPSPEGVHPHIRETARTLWFIYMGLTVIQVVLLCLAGMDLFESICHTFATLATGGFSTRNASVGHFNSWIVDVIIIFFMFLAGGNFGLYHQLIRGRWKQVLKDPELRTYTGLLVGGCLIVSFTLVEHPIVMTHGTEIEPSVTEAFRQGFFTTTSVQTTTGFCTSDFNQWPFLAKGVLVMLMLVGGCSGSTAGGIKVIRLWIAFRVMIAEIEKIFRPNVIRPIKVGNSAVDNDLKLATLAYILGILVLFIAGAGAIMVLEPAEHECSFTTAATASIATLCTIGPGLHQVGAVENYGWFSAPSKIILITLMALGRLEVFAIIVMFDPKFWKGV